MKQDLSKKLEVLGLPLTLQKQRLRARLKLIVKETHPDTSGGQFANQEQETRYHNAVGALDILNAPVTGTEIQVLTENQTALAQTQSSLLKMMDEQRQQAKIVEIQQGVDASESRAHSAITHSVHQIYTPLRIGGWGIAAVAAAITLLNKPLGGLLEELFAGNSIAAHYAKIAIGAISILGIVLGFYAKQRETREIDRLKAIMTDAGIQYLLYRYGFLIFENEDDENERIFSLSTLADAIVQHTKIRDRATCEATAEAIIKKLQQREFAKLKAVKSLSPIYTIDRELIDTLRHGVSWDDFDNRSTLEKLRVRLKRRFSKFQNPF